MQHIDVPEQFWLQDPEFYEFQNEIFEEQQLMIKEERDYESTS